MKKSHELYDATWSEDEQEITEPLFRNELPNNVIYAAHKFKMKRRK